MLLTAPRARQRASRSSASQRPSQRLLSKVLPIAAIVGAFAAPSFARTRDPLSAQEIDARIAELRIPTVNFSTRPKEDPVDGYEDCVENAIDVPTYEPMDGKPKPQALSIWLPEPLEGPRPAVVIVPTLKGRWFIEDRVAHWLCSAGVIAIIADVNETWIPNKLPDWDLENKRLKAAVHTLQTTLDWAASDPRIDPKRLGTIGTSLGGITVGLWLGVEPRLKAAMIVVGGANVPEMQANSAQDTIVDLRDQRMNAAGFTEVSQYEEALQKSVRYDSVYFANRSKAQVRMVSGTADEAVPYKNQIDLWEILSRPDRLLVQGSGHIATILEWAYWHMGESVEWMTSHL